jgi:hypothetical protein
MTTDTLSARADTFTRAVWISIAWFVVVLSAAAAGAFEPPGGGPPIAIGLAAATPPAISVWRALSSERFRAWARSLDLRFLTLLQSWRIGGLAFVALSTTDALPEGFALPAGLGDIAIGLTAPLVALYVVGRGRTGRRVYVAWTAFGILDLIAAVTLGVLYSASPIGLLATATTTDPMAQLPMVLVPAFGVSFTLVLHVISLVNLTEPSGPISTPRTSVPVPLQAGRA